MKSPVPVFKEKAWTFAASLFKLIPGIFSIFSPGMRLNGDWSIDLLKLIL
jgi:hypothetical protein